MQEKLFNIKPIRVPRPNMDTIDFSTVYEKLADIIFEWEGGSFDEEDEQELVESLKEEFTIRQLSYDDAYKLGRKLEDDFNYDVDINLVDDLGSISYEIRHVIVEAERNWVKECEIKPKHLIGDEVMVSVKSNGYIGRVVEIYYDRASYSIYIEELHKNTNTIGTLKDFEEIEEDFFDEKHWS
jgi:hypothetical protein